MTLPPVKRVKRRSDDHAHLIRRLADLMNCGTGLSMEGVLSQTLETIVRSQASLARIPAAAAGSEPHCTHAPQSRDDGAKTAAVEAAKAAVAVAAKMKAVLPRPRKIMQRQQKRLLRQQRTALHAAAITSVALVQVGHKPHAAHKKRPQCPPQP